MAGKLLYNPLKGRFDLSQRAEAQAAASSMVILFDCLASTAANDIVYIDTIINNRVLTNVDNVIAQASIGVVLNKPTTTSCNVLILGNNTNYTGLTIGDKVWLGTDGLITFAKPGSGYLQTLGIVVSPDTIYFIPNTTRILQA